MSPTLLVWLAAISLNAASTTLASAGISNVAATFESIGYAWTDAGDEYAFAISESEERIGPGSFAFSRFGSAPGYSSSAGIGVVHDSTLAADGFRLRGRAHEWLSDDVGYAACTAWSESTAFVSFTIDQSTSIQITGALGLSGNSSPEFSNQFQLRGPAGRVIASASGLQSINFSGTLAPGNYTLYLSASVSDAIDFSGGDVYDNAAASFDLTLTSQPSGHVASRPMFRPPSVRTKTPLRALSDND